MPRLLPCLIAALVLAACADDTSDGGPSRRQAEMYMEGLGGRGMLLRSGVNVNRIYAEAAAMKASGDCAGAIPKLRQVANMGPGYENAQTALGECLAQSGDLEGMTWLRRAADAGWPEAQLQLAESHALGSPRDVDEAAYWLALYQTNTGKMRVGFIAPPPSKIAAIEAAIPQAAKSAAAARAANWKRQVWLPPAPPPSPGPTGRRVQRFGGDQRE